MSPDMNTLMATQSLAHSGFDAAAKAVATARQEAQIDAAAKDFEAMFIAEMMKPMFAGIEVDPMFGGGKGEEVFRGLLLQEYGKSLAETGQIGIAPAIKAQLLHMQGLVSSQTQDTPLNKEMSDHDNTDAIPAG